METEVAVAARPAGATDPLLMVAHHEHRSRRHRGMVVEPLDLRAGDRAGRGSRE
jgi:hypothetical protein